MIPFPRTPHYSAAYTFQWHPSSHTLSMQLKPGNRSHLCCYWDFVTPSMSVLGSQQAAVSWVKISGCLLWPVEADPPLQVKIMWLCKYNARQWTYRCNHSHWHLLLHCLCYNGTTTLLGGEGMQPSLHMSVLLSDATLLLIMCSATNTLIKSHMLTQSYRWPLPPPAALRDTGKGMSNSLDNCGHVERWGKVSCGSRWCLSLFSISGVIKIYS